MTFYYHTFIVLVFLLLPKFGAAQFEESFNDGDFTTNPTWIGDEDIFIVNPASQLQLNDVYISKNEAYLSVNAPTGSVATWRFSIRLDFSPSGSNFARIYLNADQANLTNPLNGFFIKVGGISGDLDAVELVQQSGNTETVLIAGTPGGAAASIVDLVVEVSLSANSTFDLSVDYNDGQGIIDEGTATISETVAGNYFGMVCNYTSTRVDAFVLDDIFIDPILVDDTPPSLGSITPISSTSIEVVFSEEINFSNLTNANFSINNNVNITNFEAGDTADRVILSISPALTDNVNYALSSTGITDLAGNAASSLDGEFIYIDIASASTSEILINEFMADPAPQVGLPNAEYIELYNNSSATFQLSDYFIASGGNPIQLPDYLFPAGEYILLASTANEPLFQAFGNTLGVDALPTLTNVGDEIHLTDNDGNTIQRIVYDLDWYRDGAKEEGGYSIELINPLNACKGQGNYRASENSGGGTPAFENSVLSNEPDTDGPTLESLFTVNNTSLLLTFSEPVSAFSAEETLNYSISDEIVVSEVILQESPEQVLLSFSSPILEGVIYALQFENVADCLGNTGMRSDSIFFAIPEIPQSDELIINEVLFNPFTNGVDYVEIYNPSTSVFNLGDLQIANLADDVNERENMAIEHLILPNSYVCITPDKSETVSRYTPENPNTIFENLLPKLEDRSGNVSLIAFDGGLEVIIDSFDYDDDLHSGFIADKNGVSLERISFESATNLVSNWTSGAQATSFGTPGYENAQVIRNPTVASEEFFEIINPTFSPDQDGFKDFMQIQFKLTDTDVLGAMKIFDDQGREVLQLLPNQVLPPNFQVNWDGTIADGTVAHMGIYILWIELLSSTGEKNVFKEPIVVARRLN